MADIPQEVREDAYQVVAEMLEYFDGHNLATWAPLASIIERERKAMFLAGKRAVLEGLEPVAWAFRGPNGEFELHHCSSWPEPVPEGWTETPLYDLSAIREAIQ